MAASEQLRWHVRTYRSVFSGAANGLTYGAASALAHTAAEPAPGHIVPPGVTLLTWILDICLVALS